LVHSKNSALLYSCKSIEKFTSDLVSFLGYGAEDDHIPLPIEVNEVERRIESPSDHDRFLPHYMAQLPVIGNDNVNNMVQRFIVFLWIICQSSTITRQFLNKFDESIF
jgi:hypothetical protein